LSHRQPDQNVTEEALIQREKQYSSLPDTTKPRRRATVGRGTAITVEILSLPPLFSQQAVVVPLKRAANGESACIRMCFCLRTEKVVAIKF